jgi:hypothetical protein
MTVSAKLNYHFTVPPPNMHMRRLMLSGREIDGNAKSLDSENRGHHSR